MILIYVFQRCVQTGNSFCLSVLIISTTVNQVVMAWHIRIVLKIELYFSTDTVPRGLLFLRAIFSFSPLELSALEIDRPGWPQAGH